jgi:lipoate-protein ligase B
MTGIRPVFAGTVAYARALQQMEETQLRRREGKTPDTIYYLEHEPVVTYGRNTPREHMARAPHNIPCVEVPRGGLATYHGPGQLVGYVVVDLARRAGGARPDIHEFLRAIEEGIVLFLRGEFELHAVAVPGHTGVWIPAAGGAHRKICSIGVSVRRWVTAHGFALNVSPDLAAFDAIVPCGMEGVEMTSVQHELDLQGRAARIPRMRLLARALHVYVCARLRDAGWCTEAV